MTGFKTYLTAAAVLGSLCAPVAAQNPYSQGYQAQPQQAYPGYGSNRGYGYNQGTGNPVTDVIDSLLGNRYNVSDRQAVRQCANAAMAQIGQQYGGGYNRGAMRVNSITNVERRSNGLRVSGTMASGADYRGGYGQNGYENGGYGGDRQHGYQNRGYAGGAVSFRCNVAYNGAVTGLRVGRY